MAQKISAVSILIIAASLAACGGYGGSHNYMPPGAGGAGSVGPMTIGFALPSGKIGTVQTQFGLIGGYTQSTYSQVIAFPPGTTVTLKNLSSNTTHTLNVVSTSGFPANPALPTTPMGGNTLAMGFASGTMQPGATMSVKLSNTGTFFIACAFHFHSTPSMRGVIEVSNSATPGPQATAPPSSGGGGTGGGGGSY